MPTVDIKANSSNGPISISYNTSAVLTWTSTNASYCSASGSWYGPKSLSGSASTYLLTSSKTYVITCTNAYGSVSDSVVVNVNSQSAPSVDLKINGSDGTITVSYNSSAVLNWTSTNSDYCQVYNEWSGTRSTSGSESTGAITNSRTYSIVCSNSYGSASDSVSVNVSSQGQINLPYYGQCQQPCYNQCQNQQNCYYNQYPQSCSNNCVSGYTNQSCQNQTCSYQYPQYSYTPTYTGNSNAVIYASTYSSLTLTKQGRNLSDGATTWSDVVVADGSEIVVFQISVTNTGYNTLSSVVVKDTLPSRVTYQGGLVVNGNPIVGGDGGLFGSGINIGDLTAGQTKVITFQVQVADIGQFSSGQTRLINSAQAVSGANSATDNSAICINRSQVLATSYGSIASFASTGITDNIFVDLFLIPLLLSLAVVFIFKSKLKTVYQWIEKKNGNENDQSVQELLRQKIQKIKNKEFKIAL